MMGRGASGSALLLVGLMLCSLLVPIAQLEEDPAASAIYPDGGPPLTGESFSAGTNQVVATGQYHTCTILENSSIYCWGLNNHGQLGDGTCSNPWMGGGCPSPGSDSWSPKQIHLPDGLNATSIAAGQEHTCAIADNGSVYCWGRGIDGQIGIGSGAGEYGQLSPRLVSLPQDRSAMAISLGVTTSCAILDDGSLYCWGYGLHGQMGDGNDLNRYTPNAVSLPAGRTATSVDVGGSSVCAILDDGSMYCWGWNSHGQVGNACSPVNQCSSTNTPTRVSFPIGWQGIAISTGEYVSCAVIDDGSLYCWGSNTNGQLADEIGTGYGGNATSTPKAVTLPVGRTAVDVQIGGYGTVCAILDDGSLFCWGRNAAGTIGDGSTLDRTTPTRTLIPIPRTVSSVSVGHFHTCGVMDDHSLYCWGSGSSAQYGALGLGTNASHLTPQLVGDDSPAGRGVVMASSGGGGTCAVMDDGGLLCWGHVPVGSSSASDGQIKKYPLPREISLGSSGAVSVSLGGLHGYPTICAIDSLGSLYCWGEGGYSILGQGDFSDRGAPTEVSFGSNRTVVSVSVGMWHACAILDDGSLWCWGDNAYGQMGTGSFAWAMTPTEVGLPANTTAIAVSAGTEHTCAIVGGSPTDGESYTGMVYCWGSNNYGQLGDGTTDTRLSPTPVDLGPNNSAVEISVSDGFSCALLDDGGVSCWGNGGYGQLGSTGGATSAPRGVQLGTGDAAYGISTGSKHVCAVLFGGDLKCWGDNTRGQLGQMSVIGQSAIPLKVQNQTSGTFFSNTVIGVTAGYDSTCAITNDEFNDAGQPGLYCWGLNDAGQRGDGTVCDDGRGDSSLFDGCMDNGNFGNHAPTMVYLSDVPGVVRVSTALDHTCATLTDGSLQCWGANDVGQLGDGSFSDRHYPASIAPLVSGINNDYNVTMGRSTMVASGEGYTCADFSTEGSDLGPAQGGLGTQLWCWGSNTFGNLGDNSSLTNGTNSPFYIRGTDGSYNTVSAGRYFFCDSYQCWGHNVNRSIGSGNILDGQTVMRTDVSSSPLKLDLGEAHACAIVADTTNGNLACWGGNWDGQLGVGTMVDSAFATKVWLGGGLSIDVSSGESHSCAIREDHTLWCWGGNSAYQLGSGTVPSGFDHPQDELFPLQVTIDNGSRFLEVSAGLSHTCAIMENRSVRCWGDNTFGQLGNGISGSVNDSSLSVQVDLGLGRTARSIDTSHSHTCAVLDDYSLKCWGANSRGQLGDNTTVDRFSPVMVIEASSTEDSSSNNGSGGLIDGVQVNAIPMVSTGYAHTCALTNNGSVWCWGDNSFGQLGNGNDLNVNTNNLPNEVILPNNKRSISIDLGGYHSCSLMHDNSVYCWGDLQGANPSVLPYEVAMPDSSTINSISVGNHHACVLVDNSSIWCWGPNWQGEIGDGTTDPATSPSLVQLPSGEVPTSVSAGHLATCALMESQEAYCWGNGGHGQLGNGAFTDSSSPVRVSLPGGKLALDISMGGNHACAVLDDGEVYCWGDNYASRLGVGTTTGGDSLIGVPTKVSMPLMGGQNYPAAAESVDSGGQHTCAILTNKSVYCWGVGVGMGTIGDGSWDNATSPALVDGHQWNSGPSQNLTSISGGDAHNCLVYGFNSIFCWGDNGMGQLGVGNFSSQNRPMSVNISLGGYSSDTDSDGDGTPDSMDNDNDNDGWWDIFEVPCSTDPLDNSSTPTDTDFDGDCDALDDDDDNDGWLDTDESLCGSDSLDYNSTPEDSDSDGICDSLEPDFDQDGVIDDDDAFPGNSSEWLDTDGDGIGNNADPDDDNDGWTDIDEITCGNYDPLDSSSMPMDTDGDGICNALETDTDGDGYSDGIDIWPEDPCASKDTDGDGMPDFIFLNCNTTLIEDDDDDGDGWNDTDDAFPDDWNEWLDSDWDGIGNNADPDDDNDGYADFIDLFPLDSTEWSDNDMDGLGDNADLDDDDDGVLDTDDDFPNDWGAYNDTDGDGMPDELEIGYSGNLTLDMDDDNDGVIDQYDPFPKDSSEWLDTDGDGIGNNADPDDDNDGWSDSDEYVCGTLPEDDTSVPDDADGDGICNSEDDDYTSLSALIEAIPGGGVTIIGIVLAIAGLFAGGAIGRKNAYEITRRERGGSLWQVDLGRWDEMDEDEIDRLLDETEKESSEEGVANIKKSENPEDPLYWLKKSIEMARQGRQEEAEAFRETAMSILEKE